MNLEVLFQLKKGGLKNGPSKTGTKSGKGRSNRCIRDSLSIVLGHDASKFDPDMPLPDIPESNASKSARERAIDLAKTENLTVRQLAQRLGGFSGLAIVGTPKTIADEMEEWLMTGGGDGFTIMFPFLPAGLDSFVDQVIPELQDRGLFRKGYEGPTLPENLGLPRPENQYFNKTR